jgi:hypothetical protein
MNFWAICGRFRHRALVRKYCFRLGLYWQGLTHDLSNTPPRSSGPGEILPGRPQPQRRPAPGLRIQRRLLHHKGRNRHHFEYWTDYSLKGEGIAGVEMPKRYVAEMFCDRLAASRVYRGKDFDPGDPYKFFQRSMQKRILIAPETAALLETMLVKLRDEGEDAAFDYIRKEVLGRP